MRQRFRYENGRMVDDTGLPMLNQAERAMEPQAPRVISDTQPLIQSQTNGKHYDSKSELRKEYKRAGVIEVGNDVQMKREGKSADQKRREKEGRRAAIGKALSYAGFGAP